MFQIGKFGEVVEKAHARMYQTQTKDWMGQPELAGVKTTLDKVVIKFSICCCPLSCLGVGDNIEKVIDSR